LRENWVTWFDHQFSFIEVQLPGRLGYLVLERKLSKDWMEYFRKILQTCWNSALKLQDAKDKAFIDDVTQLYNQRYLHLVLEKEIKRSEREKVPFSVLFIDLDHFKNVNDSAGHLVGSKLLGGVADILRQNSRLVDYAFRYGGDEFVLILVGTDATEAQLFGERIRKQVEETSFLIDEKPVSLTISIGVASFPKHAKRKEDILRMADEAMYQSKSRNRNSVSIAG
jgi:diguanylate cyclase (GGDEF)-like protein